MNRSETVLVTPREPGVPGDAAGASSPGYRPSVIDEIYDMMSQRPHAIALTDGDLEWTYEALRNRSDLVAKSLASRGVSRGSVVGMHLPRCADAIATMLGIMGAGCVYLPLDPSYPQARLRSMLERAGAAAVISRGDDPDLYGPRTWLPAPSLLAAQPELPEDGPAEREPVKPGDYAYILFTSGSTGEPKGVMVTHENIALVNEWAAKAVDFTSFDASATTCSLSFDPSFHEILLPLSVGGTVHVIPHALALGQLSRPVSFVATTPTVASELLRAGHLPPLKVLMLGGEALAPDIAERILSSGRVGKMLNCYGPTECTIAVTLAEITAPVPEVIPIGRPVPSAEVLILDSDGQQLPDGERGEICIFGPQVADGYVNDPEGTAQRFKVGQNTAGEARRYYRTGDLGHRNEDGLLFFGGRVDSQVKINGIRVDLAEIDTALRSYPQISDAATIAPKTGRTVAYVVPAEPGGDVDVTDLKKYLAKSLPRFMVPAGVVVVAVLPKTVNGKLDTAALPEWSPGRAESELAAAAEAAGELDEYTARVIQIAADVTGFVGRIRPADDFIDDLGGTSLGIVRVLAELERDYGRQVRVSDALADTSIAGLAGLLREEAPAHAADFAYHTDGAAPPVFLVHAYFGGTLAMRRVAELLPPDQPVYGLHVYSGTEQVGDEITVSTLAEDALQRIREIQPTGQLILTGHSAGGVIAFEAARRLREAGEPEPRVLLMDSVRPTGVVAYYWGELVMNWRDYLRDPAVVVHGIANRLLWKAKSADGRSQMAAQGENAQADDVMTVTKRYMKSIDDAVRSYKPLAYDGDIALMRTRQGRVMARGRRTLGWAGLTRRRPVIIDVPGQHVSMLDMPHVQVVADKLAGWLAGRE